MIATILPGSSNFHAVGYNEHKVSKGVARLIEIQNFGSLGTFHKPTPSELVGYLQKYSSQNSRIRKPQFHVAISCKGHDMSEEELLDFAHQYLKEMGYGESGQPLLVYSHYDTENTHLHIITSRVAPDGRKIQHSHERRRSQEVIDRILGNDRKKKTEDDINLSKQYTFSSFAQFKAIMVSMGYEVYQKEGNVFVKHGGKVQKEIPFTEIESLFKSGYRERTRCRQLFCLSLYATMQHGLYLVWRYLSDTTSGQLLACRDNVCSGKSIFSGIVQQQNKRPVVLLEMDVIQPSQFFRCSLPNHRVGQCPR
ncbi:relaxase/mobilization nuclease domain-containing protein, partial [Bacteroides sp.]